MHSAALIASTNELLLAEMQYLKRCLLGKGLLVKAVTKKGKRPIITIQIIYAKSW
jgi:hypothetical protein